MIPEGPSELMMTRQPQVVFSIRQTAVCLASKYSAFSSQPPMCNGYEHQSSEKRPGHDIIAAMSSVWGRFCGHEVGDQSSRKPSQVLAHTGSYRGNLISFVLCLVDYLSFLNLYEAFVSISAIIINHIQSPLRLLRVFHIDHTNTKAVFDKGPLDNNGHAR